MSKKTEKKAVGYRLVAAFRNAETGIFYTRNNEHLLEKLPAKARERYQKLGYIEEVATPVNANLIEGGV